MSEDNNCYTGGLAAVKYSCAPELTNVANANITADPKFSSPNTRDYRLLAASPCIDTGINIPGVTNDYEGLLRPVDGNADTVVLTDMGALEAPDAASGPLQCDFSAPLTVGLTSLEVVFTPTMSGSNTNITWYGWDFQADGTPDYYGVAARVATNTFAVGWHHVKLTVSNSIAETAVMIKSNFVYVAPALIYVSPVGGHVPPFTNWSQASTTVQAAVDYAYDGSTILVTNGQYRVTNELLLIRHILLQSLNGASNTSIYAPGSPTISRVVYLTATGAVVDGFSITNGYQSSLSGGGVYLTAGRLRNCIIINNRSVNNLNGGGIYMTGGTVENCQVVSNRAWIYGGGILQAGGLVQKCLITLNKCGDNPAYGGGGVYLTGGVLRNNLIVGNESGSSAPGGGLILVGGLIENCTVVGNKAGTLGGGIYRTGGTATNTIIYYNDAPTSNDVAGTAGYGYSCAPQLTHDPSGSGNITNAPLFADNGTGSGLTYLLGNLRPAAVAPCVNAGIRMDWMTTETDLDGRFRVIQQVVDMGCYERFTATGTLFTFF